MLQHMKPGTLLETCVPNDQMVALLEARRMVPIGCMGVDTQVSAAQNAKQAKVGICCFRGVGVLPRVPNKPYACWAKKAGEHPKLATLLTVLECNEEKVPWMVKTDAMQSI